MSALRRRSILVTRLAVPLLAGLVVGVALVGANEGNKDFKDPTAGMSDEEVQSQIDKLRERNYQWVVDFVRDGSDPASLPVVELETYSAGATTLDEAQKATEVAITGKVVSATYVPSRDALTHSIATIQVDRALKGEIGSTVEVLQIGGPAWSPTGGELQQLEGDPLLLPGKQVMLLLRPGADPGTYQPVYGAGVYFVTDAGLVAPDGNAFAETFEDLSLEQALKLFE